MDEVSEFFRNGFLSLHKNAIRKNYQQETLRSRINNFNNIRRETRNTLIFQKRQINEYITPINTPEPSNTIKNVEKKEDKKSSKRLEMLKKWKIEKEKRKQEEKQKSKPLFKVCHVPVEVGLPNLEKVNKEIKGMPISQFAPPNHTFRAPKNVQPINMNIGRTNNKNQLLTKPKIVQKTNSQKNLRSAKLKTPVVEADELPKSAVFRELSRINKANPKKKIVTKENVCGKVESKNTVPHKVELPRQPVQLQQSISSSQRKLDSQNQQVVLKCNSKCNSPKKNRKKEKDVTKELLVDLSSAMLKNVIPLSNKDKEIRGLKTSTPVSTVMNKKKKQINIEEISNPGSKLKNSEQENPKKKEKPEESSIKTPKKSRKSTSTSKKTVGWKVIQTVESDDEILSKDLNTGTPQRVTKKYDKTPIRHKKIRSISDVEDIDETVKDEFAVQIDLSAKLKNKNSDILSKHKTTSKSKDVKEKKLEESSVRTPKKSRESNVISKKGIGWDVTEMVDSDEEAFSEARHARLAQRVTKKYNKTPIRKKKSEADDIKIQDAANKDIIGIQRDISGTPTNKMSDDISTPTVYISPFVTVSRGKASARKEYQVRQSAGSICSTLGSTPDFMKSISNNISPKVGADYFSKKLNNEITRIENICKEWNTYRDENDVPEEANDLIDVAIGQSKLLISKKFQQFKNLIEQCRNCDYLEKPISCEDLHGFWDMVYMQVEDLNRRFKNLDDLKLNNWQEVIPVKNPTIKRGRGRPKKASASSALKDIIKAARKNKMSNKEENSLQIEQPDETKVLTKSPVAEQKILTLRSSSVRRSLRASLLSNQARKRISSPGLTMMKVSQAIKCGNDGLTPSKSILKNDLNNSTVRKTKSVLFKDDLEEDIEENLKSVKIALLMNIDNANKENNISDLNLITFSPQTPRKSRRLSKIN